MKKWRKVQILNISILIITGMLVLVLFTIVAAQITPPGSDDYEPDDTAEQANRILVNPATADDSIDSFQDHNFHNITDIDCVYFYGHTNKKYLIEAIEPNKSIWDPNRVILLNISLKLYDPNNMLFLESWGTIPQFTSPQDSYYYLKVEDPNIYEPYYRLSVKIIEAALPAAIAGRLVDRNGAGLNGIEVELKETGTDIIYGTSTGSLKKVREYILDPNVLDQKLSEGWYFIIIEDVSCVYDLKINNTNTNMKKVRNLEEIKVNYIPDIWLDISGSEEDAVSGYELALANFGHRYDPPQKDRDEDGLSNMEEFLYGTDPQGPSFKCLLYNGLNLIPFSLLDFKIFSYYDALYHFCPYNMQIGDSIVEYEAHEWKIIKKELNGICEGSNFDFINCSEYLLYYRYHHKVIPQVILQDPRNCLKPDLIPGLNLITISVPESQEEKYTSFSYLQNSESEKVQNIRRYNPKKGKWESSCWFFGKPNGDRFPISPCEAYFSMVK